MKYFALFVLLFLLFGTAIAQTEIVEMNVQLDAGKLEEANADLSQIEIDFCDRPGEKNISYDLSPGATQDICYKATNNSDRDITITVDFVDGTITNDQWQNRACMQQGEITNFGQYVTGYETSFIVPAHDIVFKHAKLRLPPTTRGTVHGCLVYYTKGVEMGGQVNFTVLMRKAKFIDVIIQPTKVQSRKFKAVGLLLGVIVLIIFFKKSR